MDDIEFATRALEEAKVQLIPGSSLKAEPVSFGYPMPPHPKIFVKVYVD